MILKLFIITCILVIYVDAEIYKIVKTDNGLVRGKQSLTLLDRKPYYSFRGIPFAKPPVGNLRFKAPQKAEPWLDVQDMFELGSECVQVYFMNKKATGSEDCLFINVFVPDNASKLSVMVNIYGGAFQMGSANLYEPDFFLNNNVIFVTFNYRVGPFGFLSLGTPEYSGNMGMKDQLMAIRWVNENIEYFGGNKESITILGESAGGASTHYQMLSPVARGLFQRAIVQSGAALNPWALYSKSDHLDELYDIAQKSGNLISNIDDLIKYLLTVDAYSLSTLSNKEIYIPGLPTKNTELVWLPLVEVEGADQMFLPKHPEKYLSEPDNIDSLFGFTTSEMMLFVASELMNPVLLEPFDNKFQLMLPVLADRYAFSSKEYIKMAEEIRHFYFGKSGRVNNETLIQYVDLMSDCWFGYGIDHAAKMQNLKSTGKTYYYVFSLETELNFMKKMFGISAIFLTGTTHGDDLCYMFRLNVPHLNFSYESLTEDSIELKSIRSVTKLWTDFAKYGNPTPNSDPIEFKPMNEAINYVDITNKGLVAGVNPFGERMQFWKDLYNQYKDDANSDSPKREEL